MHQHCVDDSLSRLDGLLNLHEGGVEGGGAAAPSEASRATARVRAQQKQALREALAQVNAENVALQREYGANVDELHAVSGKVVGWTEQMREMAASCEGFRKKELS